MPYIFATICQTNLFFFYTSDTLENVDNCKTIVTSIKIKPKNYKFFNKLKCQKNIICTLFLKNINDELSLLTKELH